MSDRKQSNLLNCANICWMIAVVLGFAAFKFALSRLGFGPFTSMIVGIAAFFLFGWLLSKYLCVGSSDAVETAQAPTEAQKPSEVAAPAKEAPAKRAAAKTAPAKAAPKKTPAKKAPAERAAPKAAEATAESTPTEKKPRTMKAPRKAGADDLKLLKGVGPKLEQTLNELGFYHYNQVSKWGAEEIAWVDARLKFKGRIERDGWIEQAKILADGGETEFSKRSKKT